MISAARQTDVLQQEVERVKKQQEKEVAEYREKFQQKEMRREYDLSDPDRVKKAVVPIDEPDKVGLSSAQLLPGMDDANLERKAQQAKQLREWCAAQIAEKESAKAAEAAAERNYCQTQEEVQAELNQLIAMHDDTKAKFAYANATDNATLAKMRKEAREAEKAAEEEANKQDINTAMQSAFLKEDPATTVSSYNPNRPVPYHFKGLPKEYRQYVLETQMQQAQAAQQSKNEQHKQESTWDNFMLAQNHEASKIEAAIDRERVKQRQEIKEWNRAKAQETAAMYVMLSSSISCVCH